MNEKKIILLHTCCAPCGSGSIERLLAEKHEIILFFSNSNISPFNEYQKRLSYVRKLSTHYNIKLIEDEYNHESWLEYIKGFEDEPERGKRCQKCFEYSLLRSQNISRDMHVEHFTTSLSISPHKNFSTICLAGKDFPLFLPVDFKKQDGFKRSIELSKELNIYRQKYCGCEFSLQKIQPE